MRRSECGERPSGIGGMSSWLASASFGSFYDALEAFGDVRAGVGFAGRCGEHVGGWFGVAVCRFVGDKDIVQLGPDVDLAHARLGLGGEDCEATLGKVDLSPAQREQLAYAQTGADRRGEQRAGLRVGFRLAAA